jgi:uncharacterized UPF0160 family protein
VVVDVGGVYDPNIHRYDHHQKTFEGTYSDRHHIKLSSAGLVYKHFGKEIVRNLLNLGNGLEDDERLEVLKEKMYESFVEVRKFHQSTRFRVVEPTVVFFLSSVAPGRN